MPKPKQRGQKPLPASSTTSSAFPEPFEAAPAELAPLLSTFNKSLVYITHLDSHPWWFKRRIFIVPVLLNIGLVILIVGRVYLALPFYGSLFLSFMGHENETTIYFKTSTWPVFIQRIVWRSAVFLFDWLLVVIVGPWPWTFFVERPGNPVLWRWNIGFRDREVYVRASREWGAKDLLGEAEGSSKKAGAESPFFKTRILPAIDANKLRSKTGYLLMDKDWDLDFASMIYATKLLDKGSITIEPLQKTVFVWVGGEEKGKWAAWKCWELDEGSELEARKKIVLFKDRLTAMGKESLFFKWVELVQYESSAPGGFTEERQTSTAIKAKRLFEEQGVDFDSFIREVGGVEGMPGFERS